MVVESLDGINTTESEVPVSCVVSKDTMGATGDCIILGEPTQGFFGLVMGEDSTEQEAGVVGVESLEEWGHFCDGHGTSIDK